LQPRRPIAEPLAHVTGGRQGSASAASGATVPAAAALAAGALATTRALTPVNGAEAPQLVEGCQYLFGDPRRRWRLCGRPLFLKSYCEAHYRSCYLKPGTPRHRAALADIGRCVSLLKSWRDLPAVGAPPPEAQEG